MGLKGLEGNHFITSEEMDYYEKIFKILESMNEVEYGGAVTHLMLFFSVEDTEKNRQDLSDVFGKKWRDLFVLKVKEDNGVDAEGFKNPNMLGWVMRDKEDFLSLNGKQAELLAKHLSISTTTHEKDCWGDKILSVAIVIVMTVITRNPNVGITAASYFSASMSILSILTGFKMPPIINIALSVMTMKPTESGGTYFTLHNVISTLSTAMQGIQSYQQSQRQKELMAIKQKTEEMEELIEANSLDDNMRQIFEYSFDFTTEDINQDPTGFIVDYYKPISIFDYSRKNPFKQLS